MSQREAEKKFQIPRSTLKNKLKTSHSAPIGRPTVFSKLEEDSFAHHMIKMCDFHFPVTEHDFQHLDRKGMTIARFKDNMPGIDFVCGYMKRHPELGIRFSSNARNCRL
jgi:hypothetical protein